MSAELCHLPKNGRFNDFFPLIISVWHFTFFPAYLESFFILFYRSSLNVEEEQEWL